MQSLIKFIYSKDSVLKASVICGDILWAANAYFNFMAADWSAFFVNLSFITCLNVLVFSIIRDEKNTIQAMIGAIMMNFVWYIVNVFSEMIYEPIPSRSRWGLVLNIIMASILFGNHFMLTSSRRKKMWRIILNQIIIFFFLLFTIYKIVANLIGGEMSILMIEIMTGIAAMLPTFFVILCAEVRSGTYSLFQITTFNPIIETSKQDDFRQLFEELGFEKRHVKFFGENNRSTTIRMKDPFGNYVDITDIKKSERDVTLIRMNVDDLNKACSFMENHGFKAVEGSRLHTKSSESVRMQAPSGLSIEVIMHILKRR